MDLATQIKVARTKLNLSQSQMAKAWGVPVRTLQQWEQAKQVPRGFALAKLREILDPILADKPAAPASSEPLKAATPGPSPSAIPPEPIPPAPRSKKPRIAPKQP